jgi:tetratricopeptide (TPR) repeat protein
MLRGNNPYVIAIFVVYLALIPLFSACSQNEEHPDIIHRPGAGCDSLLSVAENLAGSDQNVSLLYLNQAKQMIDTNLHRDDYARYLLVKGRYFYYKDDYPQSISHIEKAIDIYKANNNKEALAKSFSFLAPTQTMIGYYPAAIQSLLESIQLYEQIEDPMSLALAMNYLGNIYIDQADHAKARQYLDKAAEITRQDPNTLLHANILSTIGRIMLVEGDIAEAENYLQQAYQIRLGCAEIRHIASSLYNLSELYVMQERYPDAINYLQEAEQIYDQLHEKTGLFNVYHSLGEAYLKSGYMANASRYAEKSHKLAEEINSRRHLSKSTRLLSATHEQKNEADAALTYFQQFHDYDKQLMSAENTRLLDNIEQVHDLQQKTKDNEILIQKNRIRRQQNTILTLVSMALLVLMTAGYVFFRLKNKELLNRQHLLEKEKAIAEANTQLHQKEKIMLKNNLELKNKELTSKTIELLHQVETMQVLAEKIENLKHSGSKKEVEGILHELNRKTRENVWDEFHEAFNNVHNEFYERLLAICPDLSSTEIKIAALLKLNLCTKEIAAISYKSESAVKTARHRLRQKLNLGPEESLISFLMKLS